MNHYSQLLTYIKTLGEADSYIHTILSETDEVDFNKMDVYPYLGIDITEAAFPTSGNTVKLDVRLEVLSIRDINNEVNTDKFWGQDNKIDNFNETLASLNRIHLKMLNDFQENNITIIGDESPLEKMKYVKPNILDGWALPFTVELPNTTINLCDGCD